MNENKNNAKVAYRLQGKLDMYTVKKTQEFDKWLKKLKDKKAVVQIVLRITRAEAGNLGDIAPVGDNISEMRFFIGPGYRLYYTIKGSAVIFILCAGDKSSQKRDIIRAKKILENLEDSEENDES